MAVGNILCGIMGGTPCTGVLVRTGVNVASGATDKISQFINAISVFIIVMIGMEVFTQIPMAVIASILITSSVRLVPFGIMHDLWKRDLVELAILLTTFVFCIIKDGAFGLMIGCFLSLLRNAANNNTGHFEIESRGSSSLSVKVYGQLSFINGLHFENSINDAIKKESPKVVFFEVSDLNFIDVDGMDAIKNIIMKNKEINF